MAGIWMIWRHSGETEQSRDRGLDLPDQFFAILALAVSRGVNDRRRQLPKVGAPAHLVRVWSLCRRHRGVHRRRIEVSVAHVAASSISIHHIHRRNRDRMDHQRRFLRF